MKALIAALIVLPMSISILNFDEITEDIEQPAEVVVQEVETEIPFEEMTVDQRAECVGLTTQEFIRKLTENQ